MPLQHVTKVRRVSARDDCCHTVRVVAREDREPIHWAWLPAPAFYLFANWYRFGPAVALLTTAVGLGVGVYVRKRGERRRETERRARGSESEGHR